MRFSFFSFRQKPWFGFLMLAVVGLVALGMMFRGFEDNRRQQALREQGFVVVKSDWEWNKTLSPETYRVMRKKETEEPFRNAYYDFFQPGTYRCASCGEPLFRSTEKYPNEIGWPTFFDSLSPTSVVFTPDNRFGMQRVEILCASCGGHVGYLYQDGPPPTGKRYLANSAALLFEPSPTTLEQFLGSATLSDFPVPNP
ncbi:MAG TPA: peptide-methionine (R)-S-oxide reductase MsrB [Thermotogota bacterium]|nr:peptide-methionine (R)-S-oxide reductase MsrB [Thermotogota bacterium]HRW91659.1 peptide-methionine (R)-S-oxide reductase MsrB [Thermotogota bacterium]